jgi:biotin transporter BioY
MAAPDSRIPLSRAIALGVTPFILFDLIKVVLVSVTSLKILPALGRFR